VPIIKKAIKGEIINDVILQDKNIQKIDLALEKIMKNTNAKDKTGKNKKEVESFDTNNDDDDNDFDENEDGNEWND
jgi:hypothetical protein